MSMAPLAIVGSGIVTAVGFDTAATCAAIRSAIDNFQETEYKDYDGEALIGSSVGLSAECQGQARLLAMATRCISECTETLPDSSLKHVPLILCLPENHRPGRAILDNDRFFRLLQDELGVEFSPLSRILVHGHTAVAVAIKHAQTLIEKQAAKQVLICGVDSLLNASTLTSLEDADRLLTSTHSDGFIPGEASAAILLEAADTAEKSQCVIHGLGFGVEKAFMGSGIPLRADGLTAAINAALKETGCQMQDLEYRISDITGEHYFFKEASLAVSRTLRESVQEMDILHPADCIGETGAAIGPVIMAYQFYLSKQHESATRRVIAHFADADGKRAAIIMS